MGKIPESLVHRVIKCPRQTFSKRKWVRLGFSDLPERDMSNGGIYGEYIRNLVNVGNLPNLCNYK